jgi:hypothetical protein
VLIVLELEGVTDVRPADDDFEYYFNVCPKHHLSRTSRLTKR